MSAIVANSAVLVIRYYILWVGYHDTRGVTHGVVQ